MNNKIKTIFFLNFLLLSAVNPDIEIEVEPIRDVDEAITNLPENPQVLVWGIGPEGFTKRSFDFYKNNVLTPLKETFQDNYTCWFYDLSAWNLNLWKDKDSFFKKYDSVSELETYFNKLQNGNTSCCNLFAPFCSPNTKVVFSSSFFNWLFYELEAETIDYINNTVITREFIWDMSVNYKKTGIKIRDTKLANLSFFSETKLDISKIYSVLQYLEMIYLIDTFKSSGDIVCLLPNNENEYYVGQFRIFKDKFETDVNEMVKRQNPNKNIPDITVTLVPFWYKEKVGTKDARRPYTFETGDSFVNWTKLS